MHIEVAHRAERWRWNFRCDDGRIAHGDGPFATKSVALRKARDRIRDIVRPCIPKQQMITFEVHETNNVTELHWS